MAHDLATTSIVALLKSLKMHGMAHAVAELGEQGAPAFEAAQPILAKLLRMVFKTGAEKAVERMNLAT